MASSCINPWPSCFEVNINHCPGCRVPAEVLLVYSEGNQLLESPDQYWHPEQQHMHDSRRFDSAILKQYEEDLFLWNCNNMTYFNYIIASYTFPLAMTTRSGITSQDTGGATTDSRNLTGYVNENIVFFLRPKTPPGGQSWCQKVLKTISYIWGIFKKMLKCFYG